MKIEKTENRLVGPPEVVEREVKVLLKNGFNDFLNTSLHIGVVGDRAGDRRIASLGSGYALLNQGSGVNEQTGADAFF